MLTSEMIQVVNPMHVILVLFLLEPNHHDHHHVFTYSSSDLELMDYSIVHRRIELLVITFFVKRCCNNVLGNSQIDIASLHKVVFPTRYKNSTYRPKERKQQ